MPRKSSSTSVAAAPVHNNTADKRSGRKRKATPALAASLKPGHQIGTKVRIRSAPAGDTTPVTKPTKQEAILDLLRGPEGAAIDAMMKITGWQAHSVRGFLSGTVRKKLGLSLVSETVDGHRRYRINGGAA